MVRTSVIRAGTGPRSARLAPGFASLSSSPWRTIGLSAVAVVAGLLLYERRRSPPPPRPDATAVQLDTVASGLEVPWALAVASSDRLFVTERAGRIRLVDHGVLRPQAWASVAVADDGECGLMGIALAPDYARSRQVYVVATVRAAGGLVNRVLRFTDDGATGRDPRTVVDGIPAAPLHAGDAIAFGPDGALYVATGDAREPARAADERSLAGKILRYTRDGTVPADNPGGASPVYALGLRNGQGLAWNPEGTLFATEHGPSGFSNERMRSGHDEINVIVPGGNYGWPAAVGAAHERGLLDPLVSWTPAIAPSGLAVYTGAEFPDWRGDLFVGALAGGQLRRLHLERLAAGWRVAGETTIVTGTGRVRAVAMGPDGFLYFTTSNRDGRGAPRPGDDHVFRLRKR